MARKAISNTDLGLRLSRIREVSGYPSRKALAEELQINPETLGGYERGDSIPDHDFLKRYRDKFAVDLNWLITGTGAEFDVEAPVLVGNTGLSDPDFIRLPMYSEVHASAGPGNVPISDQANEAVAFGRRFLRDQGAVPEQCSVIWARGTSMEPTIPDGSILVVDHSQSTVEHGCIYIFNVADRLLVKRARWRMDGNLDLVSDNTAENHPIETFSATKAEQLRVVGRLVYFCRAP